MGAKNVVKSKRTRGAQTFLGLSSGKFSGFSIEQRLKLYVTQIQNETRKRVHLGQDKGHPPCRKWGAKLSFHHEGGQLPPTAASFLPSNFVPFSNCSGIM